MSKRFKNRFSVFLAAVIALSCFAGILSVNAEDGVAINAQNFPDDNFRAVVLDNYDTDSNGYLSPQESAAVSNMPLVFLADGDINDLKGIEYFTELTSLYAADLGIAQADFSALSKLASLRVNGNAFSTLNVSQNTALKELNCRGCENLTELILPQSITALQCDGCALTSLDVSACTGLESLICYNNGIESLDLSSNTALAELNCSYNKLSGLDLSANTLLANSLTDYNLGNQTVNASATANGKTISVPVSIGSAANIVSSSLADGGYNAQNGAFEFSDYSSAQNGFKYEYNVNCPGAEYMSVNVTVSKDFYRVSYYESEGGALIDYSYVVSGQSAAAPAFPEAPEGGVCPRWSEQAVDVTSDMVIYAVWSAAHTYKVTAYENKTATVQCEVCSDTYQVNIEDCMNSAVGDGNYDVALDVNHDGYITVRDHSLLYQGIFE